MWFSVTFLITPLPITKMEYDSEKLHNLVKFTKLMRLKQNLNPDYFLSKACNSSIIASNRYWNKELFFIIG